MALNGEVLWDITPYRR